MHAERGHVAADRRGHPLDELGVEGGPPGDGRRVDGRAERGEAGQALLVHDGRDAAAECRRATACCWRTTSAAPSAGLEPARSRTRGSGARARARRPPRASGTLPEVAKTSCIGATLCTSVQRRRAVVASAPSSPSSRRRHVVAAPTGCPAGRPSPRGSSRPSSASTRSAIDGAGSCRRRRRLVAERRAGRRASSSDLLHRRAPPPVSVRKLSKYRSVWRRGRLRLWTITRLGYRSNGLTL